MLVIQLVSIIISTSFDPVGLQVVFAHFDLHLLHLVVDFPEIGLDVSVYFARQSQFLAGPSLNLVVVLPDLLDDFGFVFWRAYLVVLRLLLFF